MHVLVDALVELRQAGGRWSTVACVEHLGSFDSDYLARKREAFKLLVGMGYTVLYTWAGSLPLTAELWFDQSPFSDRLEALTGRLLTLEGRTEVIAE